MLCVAGGPDRSCPVKPRAMKHGVFVTWTVLLVIIVPLMGGELFARARRYGDREPHEATVAVDRLPYRWADRTIADTALGGSVYTTNSYGFRGKEFSAAKPAEAWRVVLLGDSFIFGNGVKDDETIAEQLELALKQKREDAEVINLGIPGANALQVAMLAESWLKPLSPDVVLWLVIDNDRRADPWNPDPFIECGIPLTLGDHVESLLLHHVYLSRVVHQRYGADRCASPRRCMGESFTGPSLLARCFRHSFARVVSAIRATGASAWVTYFPTPELTWVPGRDHPRKFEYDQLDQLIAASQVSTVDLMAPMRPLGRDAKTAWENDAHPNPAAQKLAAETIARALLAN